MKISGVNRSATVAWGASSEHASLLAAGTVAGAISDNFDSSAHLEVFKLDMSSQTRPTLPTPAAHTHTSGTALEHTLHEHTRSQHAVWYYAREASRRTSRPVWPLAAPSDKTGR